MTAERPAAEPASGLLALERMKTRPEFLRAARARAVRMPGFVLQGRDRQEPDGPARVGITCSKKVGNAVARNRAKRRLREVARLELGDLGRAGWDYVLIGRRDVTAERSFDSLRADLSAALERLHP